MLLVMLLFLACTHIASLTKTPDDPMAQSSENC